MDQYEEIQMVGEGAFGRVAKVRRKSDGMILVWKEISFGRMSEKEKQMLVAEVNLLREFAEHPHIVRYYDRVIDRERKLIYIVMEYCVGGDLSAVIKLHQVQQTYFEEHFIWSILSQIASALKVCHQRQTGVILHRDLKPSNILLDATQTRAKLSDFGLARVLSNESQFARSHVGTPSYMSPEQVREVNYNEKCDIWSLGCILYEMAALRTPFRATNQLALAKKITTGKFDALPGQYSSRLTSLIISMLEIRPQLRPSIEYILEQCNRCRPCIQLNQKRTTAESSTRLTLIEERLALREQELRRREELLSQREFDLDQREKRLVEQERRSLRAAARENSPIPNKNDVFRTPKSRKSSIVAYNAISQFRGTPESAETYIKRRVLEDRHDILARLNAVRNRLVMDQSPLPVL